MDTNSQQLAGSSGFCHVWSTHSIHPSTEKPGTAYSQYAFLLYGLVWLKSLEQSWPPGLMTKRTASHVAGCHLNLGDLKTMMGACTCVP